MAKKLKQFEIRTGKEGDGRTYTVVAEDETAAQEIVREHEARHDEPLKITKTTEA